MTRKQALDANEPDGDGKRYAWSEAVTCYQSIRDKEGNEETRALASGRYMGDGLTTRGTKDAPLDPEDAGEWNPGKLPKNNPDSN